MKHILLFLFTISFVAACSLQSKEDKEMTANDFDNRIMSSVSQMQQTLFAVQKSLKDSTNADSVLKKYTLVIDSITKSIKELPALDKNNLYKDAAVKLGGFYKKAVGTYYADIAKIHKEVKDTSAATKINEVIKKIQEEEAKADDAFVKERLAFARKNGVPVEEIENETPEIADSTKTITQ